MEQRFGSMQLMAAKYNAHCMQIVKEDGAEKNNVYLSAQV